MKVTLDIEPGLIDQINEVAKRKNVILVYRRWRKLFIKKVVEVEKAALSHEELWMSWLIW
jgi:hypothetical protein